MEQKSGGGPERIRMTRSQNTPYSRPADKRKSFLSKVSDSVKDLLTPSWLTSFYKKDIVAAESEQSKPDEGAPSGLPLPDLSANQRQLSESYPADMRPSVPATGSMINSGRPAASAMPGNPMMGLSPITPQARYQPAMQSPYSLDQSIGIQHSQPTASQREFPSQNLGKSQLDQKARQSRLADSVLVEGETSLLGRSSLNLSAFANSYAGSQCINSSILNTTDLDSSSFYPGKTVYGGMSANRSYQLPAASPYSRSERQPRTRPTAMAATTAAPSRAAQLILKALDNSGVKDDSRGVFSPAVYLRKKERPIGGATSAAPPVSLMPKKAPVHITSNVFKAAVPVASNIQQTSSSVQVKQLGSGKMRRERTNHYSRAEDDEMPVAVDLPTSFTLPISNMPSFNFMASKPIVPAPSAPSTDSGQHFSFSKPVKLASPTPKSGSTSPDSFSFSAPASAKLDQTSVRKIALFTSGTPLKPSADGKSASDPKSSWASLGKPAGSWACGVCLSHNPVDKANCLACGNAKPTTSLSESDTKAEDRWTCDSCLISNEVKDSECAACQSKRPVTVAEPPTPSWGSLLQSQCSKWSCPDCLLQNDATKLQCIACGAKNMTSSSSQQTATKSATSTASSWGDLIKKPEGQWSCSTCMVGNPAEKTQCLACGTSKPAEKATPTSTASSSGWGNLIKKPEGQWSCSTCMVGNPAEKTQCLACGTSKPAEKATPAPAATNGSGWGDLVKKPSGVWSCDSCLVSNKALATVCVACQTSKPSAKRSTDITGTAAAGWGSTPVSSGSSWGSFGQKASTTWNCDTCLVANDNTTTACVACSSPKPGSVPAKAADWDCSVCLVTNSASVSLCKSCNACKPGTQSSLGDLTQGKTIPLFGSQGVVKFGGTAPPVDTSKSLFGVKEAPTVTTGTGFKIPAGGFTFGSQSSDNKDNVTNKAEKAEEVSQTAADSTEKVGDQPAVSESRVPPVTASESAKRPSSDGPVTAQVETSTAPSPAFQFGSGSSSTAKDTATTTISKPVAAPRFQFGAAKSTQETTKPAFSFDTKATGATATEPKSAALSFQYGATKPANDNATPKNSFGTQKSPETTADSNTILVSSQLGGAKPPQEAATPSFGTQKSTEKITDPKLAAPSFQFGAAKSDTAKSVAASSFTFGASKPADGDQSAVTASVFGSAPQPVSDAKSKAPSSSLFEFGSTKPANPSQQKPSKPVGAGMFQFGNSSKPSEAAPGTTGAGLFQFGGSKTSAPGDSVFGKATESSSGSSPFVFGASSSNTQPIKPGEPAAPAFQFGAGARPVMGAKRSATDNCGPTPAKSATMTFGAPSAAPPGSGIFGSASASVFGSTSAAPSVGFQFGASPAPATSGFNFGAATAAPGAGPSASFQFGQSTPGAPVTFGSGAASEEGASGEQRVMKKAVRRIRK